MARKPAKTFCDLIVWQKAHRLVLSFYKITAKFPREEQYGLVSQLRRAIVSVPANIAEGFKKFGQADTARFLNISQGSLEEVRYYLILSRDLGYIDEEIYNKLLKDLREVSKLLGSYMKTVVEKTR